MYLEAILKVSLRSSFSAGRRDPRPDQSACCVRGMTPVCCSESWGITPVCFSRGDAQLAGTQEAKGTAAKDSRSRCRPGTSCHRRSESP